ADDGHPDNNPSAWNDFDVIVYNDPTDITDHPADQRIMEDSLFTYNIEARDEEVERAGINTYYTLDVNDGSGWQSYTDYNAGNLLRADVVFDTDAGVFSWQPNHDDAEVGTYDFRVTHYDGHGSSDVETFALTVDNRPPDISNVPVTWQLTEDDSVNFPADTSLWTLDLNSDDDPYANITYELRIDGYNWTSGYRPNGPDGGEVIFDPNTGEIQWATTNADVTEDTGGGSSRLPYVFSVRADDGHPDNNPSAWNDFDVRVFNDPTDITDHPADQTITEDVLFQYDIQATDEEVERPGINTYYDLNVNDGTGWVPFLVYNSGNGSRGDIIFDPDTGLFQWTPNNLDKLVGVYDFQVIHHDGHGSSDIKTFQLTLENDPPEFTAFPSPARWDLTEDDAVNHPGSPELWTLEESRIETSDEGFGLTYSLLIDGVLWTPGYRPNGPHGGEVFFDTLNGEIVWATTNADVTTFWGGGAARPAYQFTIVADDNAGGVAGATLEVYVADDPTDISDIPDQTIVEDGAPLFIDAVARDEQIESDNPTPVPFGTGDAYYSLEIARLDAGPGNFVDVGTYNAANGNLGSDIVFDPSTGQIAWSVTNSDVGDYTFRITHHDGFLSTASDTFNVTVLNRPPVFTSNPSSDPVVVMETKFFSYDANSSEEGRHDWYAGHDEVTYSIVEGPGDISIDRYTGVIHWQAPSHLAGSHRVTIRVDDGNGGWDIQSFMLIVDVPIGDLPLEPREPDIDHYRGTRVLPEPENIEPRAKPVHEPILAEHSPIEERPWAEWTHFFRRPTEKINDVLSLFMGKLFKQPEQEIGGSIAPITPLAGHHPHVSDGKRLDFDADLIALWNAFDPGQPSLGIGGGQDPTTPLEGHPVEVDMGKKLDFDYYPIKETVAFDLDDLTVAQLLEVD
ncbi:MAG: putative Ig domain-containing protein, partial [Desulfomonilaceae bacterium]|nr:putative Ig domain-containing protein [Desulfomonilaceae bacterium]